jgi:hypothetical protein
MADIHELVFMIQERLFDDAPADVVADAVDAASTTNDNDNTVAAIVDNENARPTATTATTTTTMHTKKRKLDEVKLRPTRVNSMLYGQLLAFPFSVLFNHNRCLSSEFAPKR